MLSRGMLYSHDDNIITHTPYAVFHMLLLEHTLRMLYLHDITTTHTPYAVFYMIL